MYIYIYIYDDTYNILVASYSPRSYSPISKSYFWLPIVVLLINLFTYLLSPTVFTMCIYMYCHSEMYYLKLIQGDRL